MNNKKNKVSNIMLVVVIIAIIGYTVANFWLQYIAGVEVSPTLTSAWFSFWGVEIFALAGIKITKVIKNSYIETDEYDCSQDCYENDINETDL